MRLLVVGAAGMLGSDLVRAAARHELVTLARDELDVRDAAAVERVVRAHAPDVVVNCAAFTDVDGAEADPEGALAVNGTGAANIARCAPAVVYPSTDYVFDGKKRAPYVESDTANPLSSYGRSKLAGEEATRAGCERHLIVRTAWLFGRAGRNFVESILAAAARGPLRVVDDQVGCPTYTGDLAHAIVEMVDAGLSGTVHVAGRGECSWYAFAREILDQAGVEAALSPCATREFPRPAPRPAYGVLGSERPETPALPAWYDGLRRYLAERVVA